MNERVKQRIRQLKLDAEKSGYILNTDDEFVESLAEGLLANKDRYGIESCPCRRFVGKKEENYDIICPCDYRDADLAEYGACYCALYVAKPENSDKQVQVPERRTSPKDRQHKSQTGSVEKSSLPYPVYRCKVCGYLCAADNPPRVCPICKAESKRFERFI